MEGTHEKIDASSNKNVQILQKYINRFGYVNNERNNIGSFAIKIDNRFNDFFNSYNY